MVKLVDNLRAVFHKYKLRRFLKRELERQRELNINWRNYISEEGWNRFFEYYINKICDLNPDRAYDIAFCFLSIPIKDCSPSPIEDFELIKQPVLSIKLKFFCCTKVIIEIHDWKDKSVIYKIVEQDKVIESSCDKPEKAFDKIKEIVFRH